jgi:hypothetical protein
VHDLRWAVLAAAALATACSEGPTNPSRPETSTPLFAKDNNDLSRANLVWADEVNVAAPGTTPDWRPAGIQGDDRDRFGAVGGSSSDEYQGAFCGVTAFIWNARDSQSGTLKVDPDAGYTSSLSSSCGSARAFRFSFDGPDAAPTAIGAFMLVNAIWKLGAGASVLQSQSFSMQGALTACELQFDNAFPPASHVRVTRLPDVGSARQWRVESQGSHRASCTVPDKRGRPVATGVSYFLPFSVTVTEVPAPHPSFP